MLCSLAPLDPLPPVGLSCLQAGVTPTAGKARLLRPCSFRTHMLLSPLSFPMAQQAFVFFFLIEIQTTRLNTPFSSIQFSVFQYVRKAVRPSPPSTSGALSSPQRATPHLLAVLPHSPLPRSLATTNLLPVSMALPISDILQKWNHSIRGLLCLLPSPQAGSSGCTCGLSILLPGGGERPTAQSQGPAYVFRVLGRKSGFRE